MNFNLDKIANLLELGREFGIMLIEDDKHDIGFSNPIVHPSSLHHWKYGVGIVTLAEFGLKMIDIHKVFSGTYQQQQQQLPPKYMGWIKNKQQQQPQNKVIVLNKKKQPALPAPPAAPKAPRVA